MDTQTHSVDELNVITNGCVFDFVVFFIFAVAILVFFLCCFRVFDFAVSFLI